MGLMEERKRVRVETGAGEGGEKERWGKRERERWHAANGEDRGKVVR